MPARKRLLITGPAGSGKTARLLEWYRVLARAGVPTDQILVLVTHTPQALAFKQALELEATGPVHAMSYIGWAQRELRLYWELVEPRLPAAAARPLEPLFLNLEQAQYLMQETLAQCREHGPLRGIRSTNQRLAILCTGNLLTVAAANGLDPQEIAPRLAAAAGGDRDGLYEQLAQVLRLYRDRCLESRALDYGQSLELYGWLRADPLYRAQLLRRVRHLIVDDLDESVPVLQDFIRDLLPDLDSAVLACCPDGGHSGFRGADPALAYATFRALCDEERLGPTFTASAAAVALGDAVAARLRGMDRPVPGELPVSRAEAPLRAEALDQAARTVAGWIRSGVEPGEIAVIAPTVDPVLLVHLAERLTPLGARVADLTRSRRLLDDPFARAMLVLALLAHPEWGLPPPSGTLAGTCALLLEVDTVRAGLLVGAILRAGDLPELEHEHLRRRIGFDAAGRYDTLRHWVLAQRRTPRPIDEFCELAATEVVLPLVADRQQWGPCRQVVESAHRFRILWERVPALQDQPAGRRFAQMLLSGTLAAEAMDPPGADPRAVLVATPYAFLTARRSVRYQLWCDLRSAGWLRTDAKELANPHVLSRRWQPGERWTSVSDLLARRENAARTVRGLLHRCRDGLALVSSELSGWGLEEEGGLAVFIPDLGVSAGE